MLSKKFFYFAVISVASIHISFANQLNSNSTKEKIITTNNSQADRAKINNEFEDEDIDLVKIVSNPAFDTEEEYKRNKKLFSVSLGLIYQYGNFDITFPGNDSILKANNVNSLGLDGSFTLNFSERAWFRFYGEGTWILKGDGVDDDISNYVSGSNSTPVISMQSVTGRTYEIQAVLGYDFLRFKKFDISFYGGIFAKRMQYSLGAGYQLSTNGSNWTVYNIPDGNWQNMYPAFTGAVLGSSLTYYGKDITSVLFTEFYLTSWSQNNVWVVQGGNGLARTTNYTSSFAWGFGIGGSIEIEIGDGLWIKPFGKFQMLMLNGNSNVIDNLPPGVYPSVPGGGTFTYSGTAVSNFVAATFGINLTWK